MYMQKSRNKTQTITSTIEIECVEASPELVYVTREDVQDVEGMLHLRALSVHRVAQREL
jgi:hypothetical protein